ncbi:MAG TPA: glycosyltransferase [Longimicrobium sp.]|jgi:cellulose synthase (UDP-forming)|uniref:glycosyltransferase family 2 protein n=1 Tax=Longimicrobium sp. TaxID=2029185 RepID=UPI002ED94D55
MSNTRSRGAPAAPHAEPLRRRPANAVPDLPQWQERGIRAIAVVTLAYWTYYIIWRWGWTLNPDALWFSIPLALAETWGLITAFVMIHSVWRIRHRQPVEAPEGMKVDVYITCYDEPLEVIRRTAIGARAIRYPHKTYVLDDGSRDEVQAMAQELGLGYIRRLTHEHAKAGNLNNALKHTDGDYILQLDADHVPLPHILDRVMGFFDEDPRLAFVQTPQDFYNTDAFTYNVDEQSRRIWEEQRLFFGVIQAGKDSLNCTFFCGCSAVIRRAALDDIGGFSVQTITEDIETSLVLHSRGWNSAFYGESLVYGLAAHNAVAFHTQHLRWGQGGMQVFKRFNPITYPGLSLSQRISYFGSLTAYVGGLQKLVYYASPLIFFFTGVLPIKAMNSEFLARFLPFLFLSFLLSEAWARGRSNTWMSERFHMVKFWTYTRAVMSIFSSKEQKFKVTPKGAGHVPFKTYSPQVTVMALSLLAVVWATLAYEFGWVDYRVQGWKSAAFLSNAFWASINFAVAASVVRMSMKAHGHRADHRFRDRFPVTLAISGAGGRTRSRIALAEDLNPGGIAIRTPQPLPEGTQLRLTLPLSTATVTVTGTVQYSGEVQEKMKRKRKQEEAAPAAVPAYRSGIAFGEMPMNVRDQIELHCTSHSVPMEQQQYSINSSTVFEKTMDWMRNARREQRRPVRMPATVHVGGRGRKTGKQRVAFLEEISAGGARLIMDEPVPPHTVVRFEVPGTKVHGTGRVVFARAIETPLGVRFAVGVQRRRRIEIGPVKKVERMQSSKLMGRAGKAAVAAMTLALAAPALAQDPVVYAATEFDAEDLQLYLVGASVSSPGTGLGWTAGVSAFHLVYPAGADGTNTLNSVTPAAGLRYGFEGGAVAGTVGYALVSGGDGGEDPVDVVGAPGGGEDGVVTQLQANYWGDGFRSGQAIALYNFGAEYYWTNFRGSQRVLSTGDATGLNLGAEAGIQGGGDGGYQAFQAGGLVEYQLTPGLRLVGVVGGKADNRDDSPSVFPYVKLEAVALPRLF